MLLHSLSRKARLLLAASLCFFVLATLAACSDKPAEFYAFNGSTMGTTYSIKVVIESLDDSIPSAAVLQQQVDARLQEVNQVMSTYIADSELSQLNKAPVGKANLVSAELLEVLLLGREISEQSGGAFDITVGPLVNLWGFGPDEVDEKLPADEEVERLKAKIGYQNLSLDAEKRTATKNVDLYLDLSSIAKGWGVDTVAELLMAEGLQNYMVEIGGELRIQGRNPSGKPWTIGVENPSLFQSGPKEAVASTQAAIATSGDYRNYREVEGRRFSHTIDPNTGKPITHALASVTVIHNSAAKADAYSTAINVLGPEKGLAFAEKYKIAAYLIVREGKNFTTLESDHFKPYKVKL